MSYQVADGERPPAPAARTGRVKLLVVVSLVALVGFVFANLVSAVPFFAGLDEVTAFVASIALYGTGLVVASVAYLALTGRGLSYLDFRSPTRAALVVTLGGFVGATVFRFVAIAAALVLGLPIAGNSATLPAQEGLTVTLLWLVPLSLLFIGPGEELLFRGVVQKRLYDRFSKRAAVVLASVPFALVHVPTQYLATPDWGAVTVTTVIVFGISLILGWVYARTDNLLVPILVHGLYDAFAVGLAYLVISNGLA
ncbi:CPBP family intramembrane glutamic endopeptidase [Halomarina litorea]|uniref:CPBP family intramembrane glutamic endopeptidase n=1 Tax=Halomarina litorea TaxID=2961595 RepID=UPI0020C40602|nr:type II CAAX endopeptidase family protein [Halomarina sp. BCD28]